MEPSLKQRLVGATVLSALAVILVPMLFEESGNALDTRGFEIPEVPASVEQSVIEPAKHLSEVEPPAEPALSSGAAAPEEASADGASSTHKDNQIEPTEIAAEINEAPDDKAMASREASASEGPEKSEQSDQSSKENPATTTAWVIQVGSFSNEVNAEQFSEQLREAGFPAFVQSGTKNSKAIFRVRIGPELDKQRARKQRDEVVSKFDVEAIILPNLY